MKCFGPVTIESLGDAALGAKQSIQLADGECFSFSQLIARRQEARRSSTVARNSAEPSARSRHTRRADDRKTHTDRQRKGETRSNKAKRDVRSGLPRAASTKAYLGHATKTSTRSLFTVQSRSGLAAASRSSAASNSARDHLATSQPPQPRRSNRHSARGTSTRSHSLVRRPSQPSAPPVIGPASENLHNSNNAANAD